MKKTISLMLLLCLTLLVAVVGYLKLDTAMRRATMYLEKDVSQEQAEDFLKQEAEQAESVQALFFRKRVFPDTDLTILEICGDARLLTQGMETLLDEDKEGCLISTALADDMFKSPHVKGQHLTLGGNVYTIRGVYSDKDKQVIRINDDKEILFEQVRVQKQGQGLASSTLREFAMRHGLSGDTLQWVEYVGIVKGLLLLALGLLAMLPWYLIKKVLPTKIKALPKVNISPKIFLVGYMGIVAFLIGSQINIPMEMIPAKWSDFTYWNGWFRGVGSSVRNILSLEKVGYEQGFLFWGIWSVIGSLGTIFATVLLRRTVKG